MYSFLFKLYILKVSFVLVFIVFREVILIVYMNFRKFSFLFRFLSNVRKTCSVNFFVFLCGKSFLYILRNFFTESFFVGYLNKNFLYYFRSSVLLKLVCVFRFFNVSGFSLLFCFFIFL